jgi:hypothetical protein
MRKAFIFLILLFFISGSFANADDLSRLLQTGQEDSYQTGDDGDLELGVSKSYTVLTTGQYASTVNVTENGKTHATSNACVRDNRTGLMWMREVIQSDLGPQTDGQFFWSNWTLATTSVTFDSGGKTITAAAGTPFDTSVLVAGRTFTVSGTVSNDGTYTVANISTTVITTVEALTDEGPVSTNFATTGDTIWDVLTSVNTAQVGGYADWRIPNRFELPSIVNIGNCNPAIDTTAFPSTTNARHWTASTRPCSSDDAFYVYFHNGYASTTTKSTGRYYLRFVRGGYGLDLAGNDSSIQVALFDVSPLRIKGTGNSIIQVSMFKSPIYANESATIINTLGYDEFGEDIVIAAGKTVTGTNNAFNVASASGDGTYTDTDSIWGISDPFTNAAGGDFTLQAGSPCLAAGTVIGSPYNYGLASESTWPDGVVIVDQGLKYEIGAYVYGTGGFAGKYGETKGINNLGLGLELN